MLYAQVYPTFNRFYCRVFLTDACRYFNGAAARCMVDNTNVVIAMGTGKDAVVAPEMAALGSRFGFEFKAHEKGDANRSARVEQSFNHIEQNFYAGRTFRDLADLNEQLLRWCEKVNSAVKSHMKAKPVELYQAEALRLKPLPLYIPEVYAVHIRVVDLEGYVSLHTNRYSVPTRFIGVQLRLCEGKDTVRIFAGHELIATHSRSEEGAGARVTATEHHDPARWHKKGEASPPIQEEGVLRAASPVLAAMVEALRVRESGRAVRKLRCLYRFYLDYPLPALEAALSSALAHGLFEFSRIERMILKNIAGDYFRFSREAAPDNEEDNEEEDDSDE